MEGLWWFVDRTSSGASAVKVIEEYRGGTYRKDVLRLTCRSPGLLRFQYGRDAGAAAAGPPERLRLTTRGGTFALGSPVKSSPSGSRGPLDVRSVDLPLSVLGDAVFTIESADAAPQAVASAAPRGAAPDGDAVNAARQSPGAAVTRVTVQSTGPGLGELLRRCGNAAPSRPETPTERIRCSAKGRRFAGKNMRGSAPGARSDPQNEPAPDRELLQARAWPPAPITGAHFSPLASSAGK